MKPCHLLALTTALLLSSCETLTRSRLAGTYRYAGASDRNVVPTIEFTAAKALVPAGSTKMAYDYELAEGYAYLRMGRDGGSQPRFKLVSADTLSSDTMGFEGTYIRVQP